MVGMKNNSQRFIIPLVIVAILIAIGGGGYYMYLKNKSVNKTEIVESSEQSADVYTEGMGYKFKTPWGKGQISDKTKNSSEMKQFIFDNGKMLLLTCTTITPRNELEDLAKEGLISQKEFDEIISYLGKKVDSGYEFTKFLLPLDESRIKNSSNATEKGVLSNLLAVKFMTLPQNNKLYEFEKGSVKGFQLGDYSSIQSVRIDMYLEDNSRCIVQAAESDNVSQSDADVIISSFTKI